MLYVLLKKETNKTLFKNNYLKEKDFQADYIKYLKSEGYRVYKIPDAWYSLKPFDIFAVKDWKAYAIELKHWVVDEYYKIYKMLRPNQVGWLSNFQEHWGVSKVVWRDSKKKKIFEYDFKYQKYQWEL